MTDRIQNLVDAGRLSRAPAPDDEIAGLWSNALQAHADAALAGMSANGRLVRAYDAGRIAASALVRSRDLRVRASNHHEMTIAVAALVSGEPLATALRELERFRTLRSDVEYGWQAGASVADVERALAVVRKLLEHGARDLRRQRPTIADRIADPAG